MELDPEDLELLGYGAEALLYEYAVASTIKCEKDASPARREQKRAAHARYRKTELGRATRNRARRLARKSPEGRRKESGRFKRRYRRNPSARLAKVKAWRAENPEKYRAIERRYKQSPKGKAMKAAVNRRQYLKRKAEREQEAAKVP